MSSLGEAEVLVVDCQATGANPTRGALLELGWARVRAADRRPLAPERVTSHLVALPEGESVPRPVERVTGVGTSDLAGAVAPHQAWRELVGDSARLDGPAVIHFARFEEPFLRSLHGDCLPGEPFPFDILCSHEVARRALPVLPRRGLRALAGYFGLSVEPLRRSASHVAATAYVWAHLVELLADRFDIRTAEQLRSWLAEPPPHGEPGRAWPMPRSVRLAAPDRPGVYRMRRSNGDLLYVGKARSLRRRINSYFNKRARIPDRTLEMLTQARALDFTETATALEAALLEVDEIKRLSPPYNVALVDRGRDVWFARRDLSQLSATPDRRHPIGPVTDPDLILSFSYLRALVAGASPADGDAVARVLGERSELPEPALFAEAVGALRACAGPDQLIALGTSLWRQPAADAEAEPELDSDPDPDTWTTDRLLDSFHHLLGRAAHSLRRACWLCALSESSLSFAGRLLLIERGRVTHRAAVAPGAPAPLPPGAARSRRERQRALDRAGCDRLRVLTTELRRIVADHPDVELRLGRRALPRDRLERALQWI